jgi:two-component system sensor histidine kinase HydH
MTNSSSRNSVAPGETGISGQGATLLGNLGRGKTLGKLAAIAVALVGTSVLHYSTPIESIILHNVYQRLYYFPIIAAAFWFGFRGAIVTSLRAALSYFPHILFDWKEVRGVHDEYLASQYAELILFQVVAVVVGLLTESERHLRERQERTSAELADAYKKLQESFEHVRRADRLSALGELSAGVAHEIKNPLASIKGSLEIVASDFPRGHAKREFVEIIEKEIGQLNKLVTEFLYFARAPAPTHAPCDIREVIASLKVLCSREASTHSVELVIADGESLPEIDVDAAQVQQALLNVVLNGIQAMPKGGRLAISATRENDGISVEIRDEGPGIAPEQRSRIFDPFYTTKARGTGLGLAIAQKLIAAQGGDIHVHDERGPGTAFIVTFPARSKVDD